ncbi:MAG: GcrA family cell cycle regulator [Rhodanobacteraceae bacterium]
MRKSWTEGHSTAEIARRIGISKNAVIGKAHRLRLPARPSPIRNRSAGVPKLPEIPHVRSANPGSSGTNSPRPGPATPDTGSALSPRPGTTPCCWPIGDPGTPGFRFCDAVALAARPYCAAHCEQAYRKVPKFLDDAAA